MALDQLHFRVDAHYHLCYTDISQLILNMMEGTDGTDSARNPVVSS